MGGVRLKTSQPSFMAKNSPSKLTVLVVDDDSTSLSIVSATLKSWKYDVVAAKSPVDALAKIRMQREAINLVVSDLHMLQMNGIELRKQINEEFNLPVIIMSSDDRESVILECLASGVVFYMVKPVNPDDLKNVWKHAVGFKKEKSVFVEKMGSIERGSSSEEISYEDIVSASSVNENKRSKRKASKRGKEYQEGENPIALKKAKVVWTNSLHNRFLQAIKHITLEKAVPKKILEFMNVPGLTREHVASHLQKYRIFLKKVAVEGYDALLKNFSERSLRSSFASGHSSLKLRNVQDYAQTREKRRMRTSSFQAGYGGSISALKATNFGSTDFPSRGAASSNTVSQVGLLANRTSFQYQSLFGNTIPIYQANQATYGTGSNDIGIDLLSRGSMSQGLMKDTSSKNIYQQKFQTRSDLHSNNMGASSLDNFGTSGWKPSFTEGHENMGTIKSTYAAEFVGMGQTSHNANVLNGGYGWLNGTSSEAVNAGLMGNSACRYLANPSVLPPSSQQQYGFSNSGQNDFTFGLKNNASVFGSIAHPTEQFGEGSNIDDLLFDLTDFQFPYKQQGGESVLSSNFPNSSYQAELNLRTNQSQSPDLSSIHGVEENAPWNELSLEQLQEIEEQVISDVDSNAHPSDYYFPNLDQNPNQEQGDGDFINSDLKGLDQLENSPSGDQGWDEEFINSLLSDLPF